MEIEIIAPVNGIILDEPIADIVFKGMTLYPKGGFYGLDVSKNPLLQSELGNQALRDLSQHTLCYYKGTLGYFLEKFGDDETYKLFNTIYDTIGEIFEMMWVIDDSCAAIENCYFIFQSEVTSYYSFQREYYADGQLGLKKIDEGSIIKSQKTISNFNAWFPVDKSALKYDYSKTKFFGNTAVMTPSYSTQKYTHNRIFRAMLTLRSARKEAFLPIRISYYVMVLECLFNTGKDEITHKISERTAQYLGGSISNKQDIFKKVKEAYNIRSKFVHGQTLSKSEHTYEKLVKTSEIIDSFLREILKRVFRDKKRFDFFLQDNTKLDKYFNEILFQDNPKFEK